MPVLARQADLLGDDADLLEDLSADIDATDARRLRGGASTPGPPGGPPVAAHRWRRVRRRAPPAIRRSRWPVSSAVAGGAAEACELAGGRRVERHAGRLSVTGPGRVTAS